MVTTGSAIEKIAERTSENREMWRQAIRQRRTEFTDIYGMPFRNELSSPTIHEYHISISPDLEYYERFQLKLLVNTQNAINPDNFNFYMGNPATSESTENLVDLTPYLIEQEGEWVTGDGYFPSEDIDDRDEAGSYYDILDACSLMTAMEYTEKVDTVLRPDNKLIRITSGEACEVTLILYVKYSTINR